LPPFSCSAPRKRVNEAEGDAARFGSLYAEYEKAPEVTARRIYNGEAARIRGNRVRDLNKVQSEAYREVEKIRGLADAKATDIYAGACNQSPGTVAFYEFTRTMQAYQDLIAKNTTLVLSTDSDLFKFLKGMKQQSHTGPGTPNLPR
jgi:membrane protease subunit HflC